MQVVVIIQLYSLFRGNIDTGVRGAELWWSGAGEGVDQWYANRAMVRIESARQKTNAGSGLC